MSSFIIGLTMLMPEELLLHEAKKAIEIYEQYPNKENKDQVRNACTALCIKFLQKEGENDLEAAMKLSKSFDEQEKWDKLNPHNKSNQS